MEDEALELRRGSALVSALLLKLVFTAKCRPAQTGMIVLSNWGWLSGN